MKSPHLNKKWINHKALRMVRILQDHGFETYLVGGCVRDLLLETLPKDFDIATTARPRQIKRLIKNCFIIGRRFRLALVKDQEDQFEISTFRRSPTPEEERHPDISDDNLFGTSKQDAYRRDFTINALFYDPIAAKVIDHTKQGLKDIKERKINIIGDPDIRLPQDPIRILRAIRFSHKNNCEIPPLLKNKLSKYASSLVDTALPRRREELLKILRLKNPLSCLFQLYDLEILKFSNPSLIPLFEEDAKRNFSRLLFDKWDQTTRLKCEPYELFSLIVLPMALSNRDLSQASQWIEQDSQKNILKFELGLFNTEVHAIYQALKTIPKLQEFEDYMNLQEDLKIEFLKQKNFGEALNLGELCGFISNTKAELWSREFLKYNNLT